MNTFKEQMAQDLEQIFINQKEFAEWCILNKHKIECIVENNQIDAAKYSRSDSFNDGISKCDLVIFYKFIDYPVVFKVTDDCYLNDIKYHVHDFNQDNGLVKLALMRT